MIKQTWEINSEERKRILNLHESATKKFYLLKEQNDEIDDLEPRRVKLVDGYRIPFPLEKVTGQPGSLSSLTKDGKLYILFDGEYHVLPVIQDITKLKFSINADNQLFAVGDEYDWLNKFNDTYNYQRKDTGGESTFYVPSYYRGLQAVTLHYLFYDMEKIQRKQGREKSNDFFQVQDNKFMEGRDGQKYILKGDSTIALSRFTTPERTTPPPPPPPPPPPKIPVELNLVSPFKFDSVELEDFAENELKQFIEDIKKNYSSLSGTVEVITSSSIDGDPNTKFKDGTTRAEYDMQLSVRRANTIIQRLSNELKGINFTYVPTALGETDQFAVGMKFPEVTDNKLTAPNRRLIIKLPQLKPTQE